MVKKGKKSVQVISYSLHETLDLLSVALARLEAGAVKFSRMDGLKLPCCTDRYKRALRMVILQLGIVIEGVHMQLAHERSIADAKNKQRGVTTAQLVEKLRSIVESESPSAADAYRKFMEVYDGEA